MGRTVQSACRTQPYNPPFWATVAAVWPGATIYHDLPNFETDME
jgi:hypothetical protein